jgi:hypothetical protein
MEYFRRLTALVIACGLLLLSGCGGDGDGGPGSDQSVASITVASETLTVGTSATQSFTATAKNRAGNALKGVSFTWASSNTSIASVGSDGLVTGIAPGTSSITASAQGITSNPVSVTVVPPTRITGTAAVGAPIAGEQVTLTDHQGVRRTATTGADGSFVITTTGLQLPFLIRAQVGSSAPLYSAGVSSPEGVINITPFTDLIVRSWYTAQSYSIDAAFSDPLRSPAVTADSLLLVHSVVFSAVRRWVEQAGVDATRFNLISSEFDADGTGIDQVLDRTTVDISSGSLVITDGATTQNSTLTYQATPASFSLETNVSSPTGVSSSKAHTVLPSQPEEDAAVAAVNEMLVAFSQAIATPNTSRTEVAAFIGTDYMNAGIDRMYQANLIVSELSARNVSYRLRSIDFLDTTAGLMTATFDRTMSRRDLQASRTERVQHHFKRYGADWLFYGDQRLADVSVLTEARNYQGAITSGSGAAAVARASFNGQMVLRGATVSGGRVWSNAPLVSWGPYSYALDSGPLQTPLPAGTEFTVGVSFYQLPVTSYYKVSTNAVTTDSVSVTNLTSHALADALGRSLLVQWSLPKSYAVETVRLACSWHLQYSDGRRTIIDEPGPLVPATATSSTIQIPADYKGIKTIDGLDITVTAEGVNGERSVAIYSFR